MAFRGLLLLILNRDEFLLFFLNGQIMLFRQCYIMPFLDFNVYPHLVEVRWSLSSSLLGGKLHQIPVVQELRISVVHYFRVKEISIEMLEHFLVFVRQTFACHHHCYITRFLHVFLWSSAMWLIILGQSWSNFPAKSFPLWLA